uniref:Uncharacterized protein n=1 Tax=Chromera velia CCMP2878 TaxID=1169474 RepID=A0A0G4GR64_9ALVE|eukprot:Cvel_22973.t1-p1 / transcript=Cvel_22973.t1 / gene=Cvel_22973 / organism=Chromera_velia_CCMP2878 / gene_product=hypothetical protein / transcript_product=hypothetical protein / location=Cvel_scaffold2315:23162-26596(-) / protein_length=405 / sequence_SO=supercontig / SO=protein_coding / is_pseudo=false
MSGDRCEYSGQGGKGECETGGGDVNEVREETGRLDTKDESLFVILKQYGVSAETLSSLARDRDSFGLAWTLLWLHSRHKARGKVPIDPPRAIDLSGTFGLSPEKIFFFLECLPDSVEEVTLDSVGVQGRGLPVFIRFLEREGGKQSQRVRRFIFAEHSIGPEEAPSVFPLLLPSLESLCLKGNPLGTVGFRALAEAIREGKTDSLRHLDLESCGLDKEGLQTVCEAFKEREGGWKVETLNVSGNRLNEADMMVTLCSVLFVALLPCLRVLLLRVCGLRDSPYIEELAGVLKKGNLLNLETLDVQGNSVGLVPLNQALRVSAVPHLKNLSVTIKSRLGGPYCVSVFLQALGDEKCPPVENVQLEANHLSERQMRALWDGRFACIRTVVLDFSSSGMSKFLKGLLGS